MAIVGSEIHAFSAGINSILLPVADEISMHIISYVLIHVFCILFIYIAMHVG